MNVPAVVAYLGDCRSATAMPLTDIITNDRSYSRFSSDRQRERESSVVRIQKVGVTKQRNVAFNKKKKKKGKEMQSFVSND